MLYPAAHHHHVNNGTRIVDILIRFLGDYQQHRVSNIFSKFLVSTHRIGQVT